LSEEIYDVLQVGFGPVGQANAAILGGGGHSVAVFERYPTLYGLPRAGHLDHETVRLLQSFGIAERMTSLMVRANKYVFQNQHGDELVSFNWDEMGVSGWASDWYVYQPDLEDALADVVHLFPNVEVNQGWEVVSVSEAGDHVALIARPAGGDASQDRIVRGRYLVAADGGNSFVRTALGIEQEDLGFHERWAVTDYRPTKEIHFDFDNGQIADPARPLNLFQLGKRHRRIASLILPHEATEEMKISDAGWKLIAPHGVTPDNAELVRHTVYVFESKIATQWRRGRCFLVGDACHVMPPFMGQGLLSGIRDVANLGWKLSLVLNGQATERLLDTYMAERRPHARQLTEMSIHAGRLMVTTDPEEATRRDAAYRAGTVPPPPQFPSLTSGVLHRDVNGDLAAPAGELAPQGRVSTGTQAGLFDDVVGRGWVLLLADADIFRALRDEELAVLEQLHARVAHFGPGRDLQDLSGAYRDYFEKYEIKALLYRPDFYVFGGARTVAELRELLADLDRQLPRSAAAGSVPTGTGA